MCNFSQGRMAAECLLGGSFGSACDLRYPRPRARIVPRQWSVQRPTPKMSRKLLRTTNLGAVDMDIYGAFQFCAIGILAAYVLYAQTAHDNSLSLSK